MKSKYQKHAEQTTNAIVEFLFGRQSYLHPRPVAAFDSAFEDLDDENEDDADIDGEDHCDDEDIEDAAETPEPEHQRVLPPAEEQDEENRPQSEGEAYRNAH